jgi:predicted Rossmann-fold nucleotide-binding protein
VVADASIVLPLALSEVPITVIPDATERRAYLASESAAYVALPGSLASVTSLFGAWASGMGKPVIMLNRHRAFEVIRGFSADVLAASVPNHDRNIQFADTVEDLWGKVVWVNDHRR